MTCRQCNRDRNVAHYHNGWFEGWFCTACVDEQVDDLLLEAAGGLPVKAASGSHSGGKGGTP